jgi:hypothetical protein
MTLRIESDFIRAAEQLESVKDTEQIAAEAALSLLAQIKRRIFQEGLNSANQPIGTYSDSYIEFRMDQYNWGPSDDVILELTGQMREDFTVGNSTEGYGLGFQNPFNAEKLAANEQRFGTVASPTDQEQQLFVQILTETITRILTQ